MKQILLMNKELKIENYQQFYLYYLTQHMHPTCRMLHAIGLSLGIMCLIGIFVTGKWWLFFVGLAFGYGFAWTGHFFLEKINLLLLASRHGVLFQIG